MYFKNHRSEVKNFWVEWISSSLTSLRIFDCHCSAWIRKACLSQEEIFIKFQKKIEGSLSIQRVIEAHLIAQQFLAAEINKCFQTRRIEGPFASEECSKCRTSASDSIPQYFWSTILRRFFAFISIISFYQLCKPRAIIFCLSEFEF